LQEAISFVGQAEQEAGKSRVAAQKSREFADSSRDPQALAAADEAARVADEAARVADEAARVADEAAQAYKGSLASAREKIEGSLASARAKISEWLVQANLHRGDSHEKRRKFKELLDSFINDHENQASVPFIKRVYEDELNTDASTLHRLMTQNVHLSNYKLKDGQSVAHTAVEVERRLSGGNLNTIQPRSALVFSKKAVGLGLSAGATIGASFLLAMGTGLLMTGVGAAALVAVALVSMLAVHLHQKRDARRNAQPAIQPPTTGAAQGSSSP
jgi:hypothetical protein